MRTGFAAVRVGIMMFVIPFVFAFYPELLLIEEAFLDPRQSGAGRAFLPGYDGTVDTGTLALLIARLLLALVLLASALAQFDVRKLPAWEWIARLVLAALIMAGDPLVYGPATALGIGLMVWHRMSARRGEVAAE